MMEFFDDRNTMMIPILIIIGITTMKITTVRVVVVFIVVVVVVVVVVGALFESNG